MFDTLFKLVAVNEYGISDYGVGGYLYQEIDGKQQLVALVSKEVTPTQLR